MNKRLQRSLLTLALLAATPLAFSDSPTPAPLTRFPAPDRIKYDGHCLTIDGKDTFIFSGAFHYFRCPKELWADRLTKIKAAGFNAIETYVAWNWHEQEEPKDPSDFSKVDLTDFKDFLKMAHEQFGLYTIIRPGPYICAEWSGGGYPRWLMNKRPANAPTPWLRSDDPTYLAWSKHWMDAVCPIIAQEQITKKPKGKPGIILVQIENEYDFYGGVSDAARQKHLRELYKNVRDNGIELPVFSCWTKQTRGSKDDILSQVFDAANCYSRWNVAAAAEDIRKAKTAQPQAPGMISELQGGWFAGVGGSLAEDQDGVTAEQCNAITLQAMSAGGTLLNYYMLFGGTNFGGWNSQGITTTYDYAAPIRESGGVDSKYRFVCGIGHMLQQHPELARTDPIPASLDRRDLSITARRTPAGDTFLFLFNPDRNAGKKGTATLTLDNKKMPLTFDFEPFAMKVLFLPAKATDTSEAQWFPQLAASLVRPDVPKPIRIASVLTKSDLGGDAFVPFKPDVSKTAAGVLDSRFTSYHTTFSLNADQLAKYTSLRLERFADHPLVVQVNGTNVPTTRASGHTAIYTPGPLLHAGQNSVAVLYDDTGLGNFGAAIEQSSGMREGSLVDPTKLGLPLENWRVKIITDRTKPAEAAPNFDDAAWQSFALTPQTLGELSGELQPGAESSKNAAARILFDKIATAAFRTTVDLTPEMIAAGETKLSFDCIDDESEIYVNGTQLGTTKDWKKAYIFDAAKLLKPGKNSITVVVTNLEGGGGITGAARLQGGVTDQVPLTWQFAPYISGDAHKWFDPATPTADWKPVSLDTERTLPPKGKDAPTAKPDSLATWFRADFELPAQDPAVWVPWKANIDASGNAFLYLNGHALGRYYDVGPQHEFYLPECWLHFGPGQKNTLVLSDRPTEKGAQLRALEIAPYAQFAEKR